MRTSLLGALLLAGCGSAVTDAQLRDLKVRVDGVEQARIEQSRRLEELDNRVFLLTDQVESQKVALAQRGGEPRLPVVTLKPAGTPGAAAPSHDSILIGPSAAEQMPEPEPPRPASDDKRPTITLSGAATPWLGPDRDPAEVRASHGEGSARAGAPPSARVAPAPALAGRRIPPRTVSPPASEGLGVSHAPAPFVDQVVSGQVAPAAAGTRSAATPVSALPIAPPAPEEDPTSLYRLYYGHLKAGQPLVAAEELRGFVKRFPQHDLADNAQYWLGESYYARGAYKDAEPEFRAVIKRWPSGNKVPDALLKLGYCQLSQGARAEGRATLEQLVEHYPRTEAAQLATRRLAELGTEGKR